MLTIAVCDDNPRFARQLMTKMRELCAYLLPDRIDCRIAPAFGSGEDVLRYMQNHTIDILFLDIDMPRMNGFRLASNLSENYPDTIIIFVSAYDDFVYSSFEYSPFRYLRKSHLEEELSITFKKVIEKYIYDSETMTFSTTEGELILRLRDIIYFEGAKNYYMIRMISDKIYRGRGNDIFCLKSF